MNMSYLPVIKEMLRVDFAIFHKNVFDKIIDLAIWIVTVTFVSVYLMPAFGVTDSFGMFMIAGLVASAGLFEVFPSVMNLVSDFEGNQTIMFYTLLPIPTSLVFVRLLLYYTLSSLFLTVCTVPMLKILFWNKIALSEVNVVQFITIMVLTSALYGALTLWTTSMVKSIQKVGSVWMRFIYPLWFLGGFQFSWMALYKAFSYVGIILLINPLMYVMEGTRAAFTGQEGYLPFWPCAGMLLLFIVGFSIHGIKRLKKRLDFI
jgi:ABC-2 type transport system permease protein